MVIIDHPRAGLNTTLEGLGLGLEMGLELYCDQPNIFFLFLRGS